MSESWLLAISYFLAVVAGATALAGIIGWRLGTDADDVAAEWRHVRELRGVSVTAETDPERQIRL